MRDVCEFLLSFSEQPSHADEENCAVIRTESSGRWQSRECSVPLPYVCKKRPNATFDPFTTGQFPGLTASQGFSLSTSLDAEVSLSASTDSWSDDKKYECDVGWQSFQAGCYKLNSAKSDWQTSSKACQRMEANLVSIHTLPELEFILRNLKKGQCFMLWLM